MSKANLQHSSGPSAMTSPAQLERLGEHLHKLRLLKSGELTCRVPSDQSQLKTLASVDKSF
jgi:hypothetical protein